MKKTLLTFQNKLQEQGLEIGIVSSPTNVLYLTGFHCDPHERLLSLLVFADKSISPLLVVPSMETGQVKNSGWNGDIIGYSDTDMPFEMILTHINKIGSFKTVGIEKGFVTMNRYEEYASILPQATFINIDEALQMQRIYKTEEEMVKVREAARLADKAIEIGMNEIAEGKTEMEILATIEFEMKKLGVSKMSFDTMVLTGANSALPHGNPGNTKIKKGDLVLFDLGVVYEGYCSDITRTFAYGHVSEEQKTIYNTVLKAELAAIDACVLGTELGKIDIAARTVIEEAGYGEYFTHRIGHGLGMDVHEFPSMSATNKMPLEKGMLFTIEPGIYVPNVGGVRIEDDIYMTENGPEIVTAFPKELIIL